MCLVFAKCDFLLVFFPLFMSDRVISQEMDDGNSETPVTIVNEMPVNAVDNEMTDAGNDMENVEDRHVVNGDSYASRAARTVSYEYPPRQQRARYSEKVMPQRQSTAFFRSVVNGESYASRAVSRNFVWGTTASDGASIEREFDATTA